MNNTQTSETADASQNRTQNITREEFDRLSTKFPQVTQASYQAGCGEYFVAEWLSGNNRPSRLVHFFTPIL